VNNRDEIGQMMSNRGYKLAAEIGVQKGEFAKKILSSWDGHLVIVDSWRQFPDENYTDVANVTDMQHMINYMTCISNLSEYEGRFTACRGLSVETSELFGDNTFDLVYIDANHTYEECTNDIKAWTKKIKPGGCICGHDFLDGVYMTGVFGVKSAVMDYFKREPDILTTENCPSWFFFI